jgi:hypothetical protein
MSTDELAAELVSALRAHFAGRWYIEVPGGRLHMRSHNVTASARRPGRLPSPAEFVDTIGSQFTQAGVSRSPLLPVRWRRDTDLTISAIQALDPWLKDGVDRVWREGYLPQPVIRFTGERDASGHLREGYLPAFVNLSCVMRIGSVQRHADLLDTWIGALSAIGIHAGRLTIRGDLAVWKRGPVSGITLFCDCDGLAMSDAVLLWHTADPSHMASDIGSGLERLRWLLSTRSWAVTVFGDSGYQWSLDVLDALRAATLLVMSGIHPGPRGAGHGLRRILAHIPPSLAAPGLGRLVRKQHAYWAALGIAGPDWPQVSTAIEDGVLALAKPVRPAACLHRQSPE